MFLESADRLTELYITQNRFAESVDVSQKILGQDNCWERAYRHLMIAFDQLGDHGQVGRTYQRCVQTLQDELDIGPAPETERLYYSLTNRSQV
jgi:DNA-binding SARP family transcriptional activator